jgi:non-ribosomal peptide synthetase component F
MFVNTLVLRVDLRGRPTWRELLERVRAASLESYRNADAPFDAVAAALHPGRDLSRPPLTPVYIAGQEAQPRPPDLGERVQARFAPLPGLHVKYELELTVRDGADRLELHASYATEALDAETVNNLLAGLEAGARNLAAHPDAPALRGTA